MTELDMITAMAKSMEESSEVLLTACEVIHDLSDRVADLERELATIEARMIAGL